MKKQRTPGTPTSDSNTQPHKAVEMRGVGMDELMIVNPGLPEEVGTGETIFLGEDGALYQVEGLADGEDASSLAEFYLGDDGRLYQLHGLEALVAPEGISGAGRLPFYFLGEDGTHYEIRRA
jgi:hypothetical protein